jgi:hypothetical protein
VHNYSLWLGAGLGTKAPSGKALISVSDPFCSVSVAFPYGQGSNQPNIDRHVPEEATRFFLSFPRHNPV